MLILLGLMGDIVKFIIFISMLLIVLGCSTKHLDDAWTQSKIASYNAVTDPMTWAPAIAATSLYLTKTDDEITDYFMDHSYFNDDSQELYAHLNETITLSTALLVPDDRWQTKARRFTVETGAYAISRQSTDALKTSFPKESPNGKCKDAIGSHHAISPFAGTAMTRRNVAQMNIPIWAKNSIVGTNYLLASSYTLIRVQQGGHSFADQLVSVSVGNFIGLFVHDFFMLKDKEIAVKMSQNSAYLNIGVLF
ncbi:MAG: hypothetical protein HQL68_03295 [Magnetococcales bacterium]|nr:hypothetical protein [Magnetococcales bacterium]